MLISPEGLQSAAHRLDNYVLSRFRALQALPNSSLQYMVEETTT
jgi:hypothetical protein